MRRLVNDQGSAHRRNTIGEWSNRYIRHRDKGVVEAYAMKMYAIIIYATLLLIIVVAAPVIMMDSIVDNQLIIMDKLDQNHVIMTEVYQCVAK